MINREPSHGIFHDQGTQEYCCLANKANKNYVLLCPQIYCYMEQLNNRGVILCSIFLDGDEAEKVMMLISVQFLVFKI